MKDFFVGMAIGVMTGAMVVANPKARRMMADVKSKVMSDACDCKCHDGHKGPEDSHENRHNDGGSDWQ